MRARTAPATVTAKPGRRHTKPLAIVYQEGSGPVCAGLIDPRTNAMKIRSSSGPYSALGCWMDEGYNFGPLQMEDIPEWASARLPPGCNMLGVCRIAGFPLI